MVIDQSNNLDAFNKLADQYDKYRPSYPDILFQVLEVYLGKLRNEPYTLLDVGCGTGISTRKLYDFFGDKDEVIGLEPCEDMRLCAQNSVTENMRNIKFITGRAEEIALEPNSVKCVLTAQAIQWFEREKFYKEVNRILVDNGCLAILQNNRNWMENAFLEEYELILEKYNPDYNRGYRSIDFVKEVQELNLFKDILCMDYRWENKKTLEEFIGMASSSTKANKIIQSQGLDKFREIISSLYKKHCDDEGNVNVTYKTELFLFRKR